MILGPLVFRNTNQDFFYNTIGRGSNFSGYPDPTLWNFKVTSLETKSEVGIYSSERSYVWCKIRNDSANGSAAERSLEILDRMNQKADKILEATKELHQSVKVMSERN